MTKIGIETHVELKTETKLFSSALTEHGLKKIESHVEPNSSVNLFDIGLPGTLPRINKKAVELAILVGKALNCSINPRSSFCRKQYYYPDLPLGFQISQTSRICDGGYLDIGEKIIGLSGIHIEQDTAKLTHLEDSTLIDFNRAGCPLVEIVTLPCLESAKQAIKFLKNLIQIIRYTGASDCDLSRGQVRFDVNFSHGSPRVEIKNLNSFETLEKAVACELNRVISGEKIQQETRGFDGERTFCLRQKEETYRYLCEPNVPTLDVEDLVERLVLPELPQERRKRYGCLNAQAVEILLDDLELGNYFDKVMNRLEKLDLSSEEKNTVVNLVANLLVVDVLGLEKKPYESKNITYSRFSDLCGLLCEGKIPMRTAKNLIIETVSSGIDPLVVVKERNLLKITDREEIGRILESVVLDNEKEWIRLKEGEEKLLMFFLGSVIKKTEGRADPEVTKLVIKEFLKEGQ